MSKSRTIDRLCCRTGVFSLLTPKGLVNALEAKMQKRSQACTPDNYGISPKKLERLHGCRAHGGHRVVIRRGLIDNKTIRAVKEFREHEAR